MNSFSFLSSFIINIGPIVPNLNNIFANKYDVEQEIMRNN
jgi:hypothetical protein